jgi:methylmalonyl-CoA decarboxylase subunit alpha
MFSAGGIGLKLEWPSAKWARCPVKGGVAAAYKREISAGADPKQRERELEAELRELTSPFGTQKPRSLRRAGHHRPA